MSNYIAIDIGGTQMRVAVYAAEGTTPLQQKRISTQGMGETPLDRLENLIASIWPAQGEVAAIGIAVPGPTDQRKGILYEAPNIPGWVNLPLRQILEDRFHVPVALGNDANLAALGEWEFGAGQGHHDLVYLTVSTGIGGGVICDDELLLGARGLATELGHITILPDGPICGCGQRGHLEALASGTAIAKYVASELALGTPSSLSNHSKPSAREISAAAQQGDALARAALARAGHYLGLGVANFLQIFNPTLIIFGGGVSNSLPLFIDPMREAMEKAVMSPEYLRDLSIKTAALGDEAGLMGAYALARSS